MVVTYDITDLSDDQVDALEYAARAQAEGSDDEYPPVDVVSVRIA